MLEPHKNYFWYNWIEFLLWAISQCMQCCLCRTLYLIRVYFITYLHLEPGNCNFLVNCLIEWFWFTALNSCVSGIWRLLWRCQHWYSRWWGFYQDNKRLLGTLIMNNITLLIYIHNMYHHHCTMWSYTASYHYHFILYS